jgi:hypothetical protein
MQKKTNLNIMDRASKRNDAMLLRLLCGHGDRQRLLSKLRI